MTEESKPWGMEENSFLMMMHLSQLSGFIIPFAGLVLPIVMWATNKDKSEHIDQHGKVILNWMISAFIYAIISFVLMFVVVGFVTFFALVIIGLVFTIIGAIKANEGTLWAYPLSIKFFRIEPT